MSSLGVRKYPSLSHPFKTQYLLYIPSLHIPSFHLLALCGRQHRALGDGHPVPTHLPWAIPSNSLS